jgi:hypothetical protein
MLYHHKMRSFSRLASVYGSFAANAALLLSFELSGPPGDRWPVGGEVLKPPVTDLLSMPWRPFIDNPGENRFLTDRQPRCPRPEGIGAGVRLDHAPLPPGYDPHGYPGRKIFACVRIDGTGRVIKARLIGAVSGRMEARLVRAIRRQWRFAVEAHGPSGPSWQRVRLNAGPVDTPVPEPSLPLLL